VPEVPPLPSRITQNCPNDRQSHEHNRLAGVVTRTDIDRQDLDPDRPIRDLLQRRLIVIREDSSIRDAIDRWPAKRWAARPCYDVTAVTTSPAQ
jgi:CBS domain-containing protein